MQGAPFDLAAIIKILDETLDISAAILLREPDLVDLLNDKGSDSIMLDGRRAIGQVGDNAIGELALKIFVAEPIKGVVEEVGSSSSSVFHNGDSLRFLREFVEQISTIF